MRTAGGAHATVSVSVVYALTLGLSNLSGINQWELEDPTENELPPISWTQEMGGSSLCLMTCA